MHLLQFETIFTENMMKPMPFLPRDARLTQRSAFPHWLTERVRWSDTDQIGHVNNVSFCTYLETGRTEFLRDVLDRKAAAPVLLLTAQINVCFLGEIHWPSNVDVGTCILEVNRSSCRMGHGLFVGERCVGTADTLLVNVDEDTRQPLAMDDGLCDHLGQFLVR